MNKRAYRRFIKEFELDAVRSAEESDKPVTQVARGAVDMEPWLHITHQHLLILTTQALWGQTLDALIYEPGHKQTERRLHNQLLANMKTKYDTIKDLHCRAGKNSDAELLKDIPNFLESFGVKLRENDGILHQINISNPENGVLVVGLRYKKKDETLTEDLFEVNVSNPNEVSKFYKGKYEHKRAEYKGTHKQQNISLTPFTSVNTCCLYVGGDNDS